MKTTQREPCPHCGCNEWREKKFEQFELLNPNEEFVEGYGHMPVSHVVGVTYAYYCASCNWKEGGNPTIIVPPWRK